MAAPASPSRRPRSRHHHHHHNDHGSPAPTPSTPTSPKSPTSSRQTSRDRTLQSPTRPSSTSRQHTRSSSQNHSRRSASRDGDLHQRPITYRRHTTQLVPVTSTRTRPLPPIPHESHEDKHEKSSRSRSKRSHSTPAPIQKDGHILIPVPIRAHDAQTPLYVRAPPGQSVDFVVSVSRIIKFFDFT